MATIFDYENRDVTLTLTRKLRNKNDETAPVFWRVTYNRKLKHLKTGLTFGESEWSDFLNRSLLKHKDTKTTLTKYRRNVLIPAIDSLVENNSFSFEALDAELGRANITNLNEAFGARISELFKEDRIKYGESLKSTLNSLEAWKGKDIPFNSITQDFLRKYEQRLLGEGKSRTTVGIYMRNIRTIINGGGEPYLTGGKYPFGKGKYVIPKGEGRKMALRLEQIHLMQSHRCEGGRELYRDMWLFSFYANGINMTDVCRLKYEDIKDGEITFIRKKTKNTTRNVVRVYVPIIWAIKEIIKKHGNRRKDGYIFPFLDDCKTEKQKVRRIGDVTDKVNDAMGEITRELNLPDVTTYAARHSYVTILERMSVPRVFLQNSLGHTVTSMIDHYSNPAEKEERYRYNSLLLPKTNEEIVKSLIETAKTEIVYN